ncbi:hypothetical protein O0I10_013039 [Lichtheimia ornata]|uniref:Uncharacterized protein n=1 Tax=Lichtheimia ornata TaxID=688661 RepID=A0AAD7US53_9FUNG|nr:uncharacterized protein O0I10_013039 [Lichtheimia ornata]KAJ8651420.1 hypothetical protein O0I10_013039 [Lichtheimia ornata]
MTVVESIRWCELLGDPIVTVQHGNDGNRIATATETLQQTAQQFVKVLNERARLLSNSAQFDTALRDAAAIRALLPRSGLGYVCGGDVHCHQGRYAAAISIYDQGLVEVPESDPYYQQLQQHRIAAATNNKKRVDFISQLPLDTVITNIIPRMERPVYLDSNVLYEPLYVSRTWQERILQQSKDLKFRFRNHVDTFQKGHAQLVRFAPYVQTLNVCLLKNVHVGDLFSRAHFSNLKELDITCAHGTTPRLPLIHGLQMIADSLTHLAISQCPGLALRDILETCPNLVFLKTRDVDAFMPLSSSYPKIKHLELHEELDRIHTHEHMVDVLSRFPSLRMLKITPMPATTILPILRKHCPYLEAISLECRSPDFDVTTANDHPNRRGITSAYLGGDDFYYQDHLIEFLYEQRNSLEIFDFRGTLEVNNALWEISNDGRVKPPSTPLRLANDLSSPLSFTQLVDLRFTNTHPSSGVPMILWIVLNAPNLSAIHLPHSHFQPAVVQAMIKLKHLHKVQIEHQNDIDDIEDTDDDVINAMYEYSIIDEVDDNIDDDDDDDDDDGIHQFFAHHVALGDRSTLEHVVVRMYSLDAHQQTWLPLLSRLTCLKILELCGGSRHNCTVADNCIPILKRIHLGCPAHGKAPSWLGNP